MTFIENEYLCVVVNRCAMGLYINKGNRLFQSSRRSEYVDKSGLIAVINDTLGTRQKFSCVSRCRRFGKSMAAEMLAAYYDKSCDSRELFADLEIAKAPSFEEHLNKYPVLYLDMTSFVTRYRDGDVVAHIEEDLKADVTSVYPDIEYKEKDDLLDTLSRISLKTGDMFFFIIDEWDAICREYPGDSPTMKRFVDWLRRLFKSEQGMSTFIGVYMTGILPIKKYKTQSALNNFIEYSVITPRRMARFFGFTGNEVKQLSLKYGMPYDVLEKWYDGYKIGNEPSMFNPNSVMQALSADWCTSYWGKTATYDVIVPYIKMNFDGLKDDILNMLAGGRCHVNPAGFQNDLALVESKDDALTVLIHLGYLSYDRDTEECFIPNLEVSLEMELAVKAAWPYLGDALEKSRKLLEKTLAGDENAVATGIDLAHDEHTSILSYNDENSLACVLSIAYYYARNNYVMLREFASGKGFADLVLIPRKNVAGPALLIELKYNKDADTALNQIKRQDYPARLEDWKGNLLLVGINYDKATKTHSCRIERG